jgi:drug/metabolite transporter (DMT)-like permease
VKTDTLTPRVIAALAAVYLIWGSTYLAIAIALRDLPPFLLSGLRVLLAGVLLFGWLVWRKYPMPTRREWRDSLIVGALLLGVGNGGVVFAQQWVPSAAAALAVASMPIWATLFGFWFGRPSRGLDLVAVGVGFLGVALLNLDASLLEGGWGAIALLIAPMAWAFGSTLSARLTLPKGLMMSATQMLMGGLVLCVIGVVRGEPIPEQVGLPSLLAWAWLVFGGSIVAYSAYVWLLENVRPALATSYAFVNPLVAVLLGITLAGESLELWGWLGMLVIVGAVATLTLSKAKS